MADENVDTQERPNRTGRPPTKAELIQAIARATRDPLDVVSRYVNRAYPGRLPAGVGLDELVAQYGEDREDVVQPERVGAGIGSLDIARLVEETTNSWMTEGFRNFGDHYRTRVTPRAREARIKAGREKIYELIHGGTMNQYASALGLATDQLTAGQIEGFVEDQGDTDMQYAWDRFTYGGAQGPPSGPVLARDVLKDPIQMLLGFGRSEAMAVIRELDDDDFISLQHRMFQAGLYGDKVPAFGVRGTAEQTALDNLMIEAMNRGPNMSLTALVDQLTEERMFENSRGLQDSQYASWLNGDENRSTDEINVLTAQPIETYESTVDSVAMALMGMTLDPTARRDLAVQLRNKDLQSQRSLYAANDYVNERLSGTNSDSAELEAFLKAVASVESGGDYFAQNEKSGAFGKYQFMPQYWSAWARQAGLPSNADIKDPRNQEIVARYLATSYYRDYGNWYDVAVAWNGGPRRVGGTSLSQGIANYANTVVRRKNEYQQESVVNGVEGTSRDPVTGEILVEAYDGMSEAQRALRVARSDDIYAYSFAQQAQQFFSLLGGVV